MTHKKGKLAKLAKDCIALCLMAILLWVVALCVYEILYQRDAYQGMQIHHRILFVFQIVVFIGTLALSLYRGLSIGWVISMFLIAMLCSSYCTPSVARAASSVREQLELDKYFEFGQRSVAFSVFSILQILGFPIATLSKSKFQRKTKVPSKKGGQAGLTGSDE